MSSTDESPNHSEAPLKKKRGRACDQCRQKKVRCDGKLGKTCSNCVIASYDCTYVGQAKKRYPDVAYMENLETQLANMKKLLNKLHPGVDFSSELNGVLNDNSLWRVEPIPLIPGPSDRMSPPSLRQASVPAPTPILSLSPTPKPFDHPANSYNDLDLHSSDEEESIHYLRRNSRMERAQAGRPRFLGKSSRLKFLRQVLHYREQYSGDHSWRPPPRPEFWHSQPWIQPAIAPEPPYPLKAFPPPDLLKELVNLYFIKYNIFIPLLHRPTFEDNLSKGHHLTNAAFGNVVLLVCAIGSRTCDDERVLMPEEIALNQGTEDKKSQSAGWKYFREVQTTWKAIGLTLPGLFHLQMACLATLYLYGSSTPHPTWPMVGMGLRWAQELGAHRRKTYKAEPNVEDEQLKRAFWALVTIDRSLSSGLGRPTSIQDEDFDVDLPLEVDDEYWVNPDPALAFKQPSRKPSSISYFVGMLRLKQIHAYVLRTIYATNKSKVANGYIGPEFEQNIVSELDSTLNRFIDTIPDHLRWDPNREDKLHLAQSAYLYAAYYMLQISVHRPFIPSPGKPSPLSFPSLAICTNAARSCIHVLDMHFNRTRVDGNLNHGAMHAALFTAGVVLLLNIWGGKISGSSPNPVKEMAEVHKAMRILKAQAPRWVSADRYRDVLYDLASVGDLPLPQVPPASNKRPRHDEPEATEQLSPEAEDGARHFAGTKRVQTYQHQQHQHLTAITPAFQGNGHSKDSDFVLPVHSADLGSLPLHSPLGHLLNGTDTNGNSGSNSNSNNTRWYPAISSDSSGLPQALISNSDGFSPFLPLSSPTFNTPPPLMSDMRQDASTSVFIQQQAQAPAATRDDIANLMAAVNMGASSSSSSNAAVASASVPLGEPAPDSGTLAMWSTAPYGFEWDDWGSFISSMGLSTSFDPSAGI